MNKKTPQQEPKDDRDVSVPNDGNLPTTSKKCTIERVKNISQSFSFSCDPEQIYKSIAEEIDAINEAKKDVTANIQKVFTKRTDELTMSAGIGTMLGITETVGARYRPLIMSVTRQIIAEYKCVTPSEKALAELAASAYVRVIEYSKMLHGALGLEFLSAERNGYYGLMSKEVDRAQRHFQSAIATLAQMKNPPLSIKVTSQTAFVAQNQQLNATTGQNSSDNLK